MLPLTAFLFPLPLRRRRSEYSVDYELAREGSSGAWVITKAVVRY